MKLTRADIKASNYSTVPKSVLFEEGILESILELQCATDVAETILENDTFRYWSTYIRIHFGIYSGYSAPWSRIAGMEIQYFGMRIAPKQTLSCIIPITLIPD